MNRNTIFSIAGLFILCLFSLSSCQSDPVMYDDAEYVLFSDSVTVLPVTVDQEYVAVYVGSTVERPYDRHFAIEVLEDQSNVAEGFHYELENYNVVIKAGQRSGEVRIKGLYENMQANDSLCLQLALVADQQVINPMYGNTMRLHFHKCYPLVVDDYVGDMLMYASFPFSTSMQRFLRKAEKHGENSISIKSPFTRGYDLVLYMDGSDPLFPKVIAKDHISFVDTNYGKVSATTGDYSPSYFSGGERRIYLKMDFYVRGLASFGEQGFVFEWISPEDAELYENGIIPLN